jgi:ABC-type multidrug transport system ATPase subunit
LVLQESKSSTASTVILVRDLVQKFKKRKQKSLVRGVYTAVDHLNFHVAKRACFGLLGTIDPDSICRTFVLTFLGANGAGKTTTFRMLINDIKPTSGKIIINGKNINKNVVIRSKLEYL